MLPNNTDANCNLLSKPRPHKQQCRSNVRLCRSHIRLMSKESFILYTWEGTCTWHLDRFSRFAGLTNVTNKQTHSRSRYSVCSNIPHPIKCMWCCLIIPMRIAICCQSPVHTSNNVEATFDFVEATFDLCRKNRSTCSIRECCFDVVAGVDGALESVKHGSKIHSTHSDGVGDSSCVTISCCAE